MVQQSMVELDEVGWELIGQSLLSLDVFSKDEVLEMLTGYVARFSSSKMVLMLDVQRSRTEWHRH